MEEDMLREFLIETYENLEKLDSDLLVLEKSPDSKSTLDNIFRVFHSCKGACGFLGLSKLETIAHAGENLLGGLRDGAIKMNSGITDVLLATVDAVRKILSCVENYKNEGNTDYSNLLKNIYECQSGGGKPDERIEKSSVPACGEDDEMTARVKGLSKAQSELFENIVCEILSKKGSLMPEDIEAALSQCMGSEKEALPCKEPAVNTVTLSLDNLEGKSEQKGQNVADSSIRVNIELLDKLMNLVGELVLIRNQLLQLTSGTDDGGFISISQRLNLITSELQEGIMKTRMQPINNIWRNFPRVVRDVASTLDKKVRLEMHGKETELDKTIIEAIKDPLTHILRNSIDHGIENLSQRIEKNKAEEGLILLRAYHEGGQVNIEIIDDGAGINIAKVKQKAIKQGIITAAQASVMTEREIANLVFMPGFSTAEKVTNISGRGVGMDVVRKNIEKIGGTVDIENRPGNGTTVKIKIPLTLAIIPGLIVTSGGDKYAIPQVSLLEVVRLKADHSKNVIEEIHGTPVYRLRGKLLPIVYLNRELKLSGNEHVDISKDDDINIVVLQAGDRQFGLIVDVVNDTEEIVVKPMSKQIKEIPVFAGATIRGDGRIALILDILGIAKLSGVVSEAQDRWLMEKSFQNTKKNDEIQQILLFKTRNNGRMALPLSKVSRLEIFNSSDIEKAGKIDVVQYRGQILPLIYVSSILPERRNCIRETVSNKTDFDTSSVNFNLQVVVYSSEANKCVGLVVDSILDIIETNFEIQRTACRDGVLGSAVIQSRVTEILDMENLVKKINPSFFNA